MNFSNRYGSGQYLMVMPVVGIRSIYDTEAQEDVDISECKNGVMGNFCREGIMPLIQLQTEVDAAGGVFRVSDMFRDRSMQIQAHHDYISGRKKAYSPPPGFSCHEAGRSIDVDIETIQETLNPTGTGKSGFELFWEMYNDIGFTGVRENRKAPAYNATEAWHIDYMGIFKSVYNREGYKKMAMVAIMDAIGDNYIGKTPRYIKAVRLQAYLLGLGLYKGAIDGIWGNGSARALKAYNKFNKKDMFFDMVLEHYRTVDVFSETKEH